MLLARRVVVDLCTLARRDHDDLDRTLLAMVAPDTPSRELPGLLDVFRLCLAIHGVAEHRVFETLITLVRPPSSLRLQIALLREEHRQQQEAAERLGDVEPGSDAWYSSALELRVLVLDHAKREDYLRTVIEDHVPVGMARGLVAQYATERMRLLATTSPLTLARAVHAA
jgi:hypothetical protein